MIGAFSPLGVLISLAQASPLPATDNIILSLTRN